MPIVTDVPPKLKVLLKAAAAATTEPATMQLEVARPAYVRTKLRGAANGWETPLSLESSRDLLAYRELEKHFNTLHKQLMPAVRGKLMEISRAMYPKGPPKSGGFPMKLLDEATGSIIGAIVSWKPKRPCPNCDFTGCLRCDGLGFLRGPSA